MHYTKKKKIIEEWRKNHGAANFELKSKNIIFNDGGLFYIEKEVKKVPRTKMLISKKPDETGSYPVKFVKVKGPKVIQENYNAYLWFEELRGVINYLKSMEKMLNQIGYKTNCEYKEEFVKKFKNENKKR